MTFVHPDYRCPGCDRPIEPLAQLRTYHTQCDPQGRVEMLERALGQVLELAIEIQTDLNAFLTKSARGRVERIEEATRAALAYKPAQMKGREG